MVVCLINGVLMCPTWSFINIHNSRISKCMMGKKVDLQHIY